MVGLIEVARSRAEDPDALVAASLACPICLCSDEICWEAALEGYDPSGNVCVQPARSGGASTWRPNRRCGSV